MSCGLVKTFVAAIVVISRGIAAQNSPDEEFSRAMRLAASGRFADAERSLRALESAHPKVFEVRYRLGLVLLRQDKAKQALQSFQASINLAPNSALAWVGLAQARLKLSLLALALEAGSQAAKLAGEDPAAWRALALFYADAKEFAKAAEYEERWAAASPNDAQSRDRAASYYVLAGKAERANKQPGKAADAYQNAMRLAPENKDSYFELAALLLDHRTPEPAIPVLQSAVARFPKESEFRRLLGLAHYQTGKINDAISDFSAVCDLEPASEIGYASLETLLTEAGPRLPEIIGRFQAFRAAQPANPIGHYLLARALTVKGAPSSEVELLLRESVRVAKDFWPGYYELGVLLESEGKSEEALESLTQAALLNPSYAPTQFALARIYAKTGDRAKAVEHRRLHGQLLAQQRNETERARQQSPALRYRPSDR